MDPCAATLVSRVFGGGLPLVVAMAITACGADASVQGESHVQGAAPSDGGSTRRASALDGDGGAGTDASALSPSAKRSAPETGFGASPAEDITLATATLAFTTQWGPTRFNLAAAPDGYDDCGPTSLLMAASFFGYLPRPTPSRAEGEIENARNLTRGVVTPVSSGTPTPMIYAGLAALGLPASAIASTSSSLETAVAQGAVVILAGDPGDAWGRALDKQGHYLHRYGLGWGDVFGHWVVVFGRAVDGVNFVVGDPLSTIGPIKASASAIETYIGSNPASANPVTGGAIQVGPVQAVSPGASIVGMAGKCVDDSGDRSTDGTKVQLWGCNGTDAQQWTYTGAGQIEGPGGKCLDVIDGNATSGTKVQIFYCNLTASQTWTWIGDGPIYGLGGYCLDDRGGRTANGTDLQIWKCNGTAAQGWSWGD